MLKKIRMNSFIQRRDLNHFNYKSRPLACLTLPSVLKILSLQISEHGHAGVIFIELPQGSFVIKANADAPRELFYNKMAKLMGLKVPQIYCFTIEDSIHSRLLAAIEKYCQNDESLFYRIKSKFNSLFYAILQYIPSIQFQSIGPQKFKANLCSAERLHQLGLCLGFDMIINNHDRFQLIWKGDGNLSNVLVQVELSEQIGDAKDRNEVGVKLGPYVFIDNQGQMYDANNQITVNNLRLYFERVIQFLKQAYKSLQQNSPQTEQQFYNNPQLHKFLTQLELYTKYKLTKSQTKQIILGIRDLIDIFIHAHKSNQIQKLLYDIKSQSDNKMATSLAKHWTNQLETINLSYCDLLFKELVRINKSHYAILRYIRKGKMIENGDQVSKVSFVSSSSTQEDQKQSINCHAQQNLKQYGHSQPIIAYTHKLIEKE